MVNHFHHENTHGRVFQGLEARDMLELEKRGSLSHVKLPAQHGGSLSHVKIPAEKLAQSGSKSHVKIPAEKLSHAGSKSHVKIPFEKLSLDNKLRFIKNGGVPQKDSNVETVYSQVYVTATPTGTAPVDGYSTDLSDAATTAAATQSDATSAAQSNYSAMGSAEASYLSNKSLAQNPHRSTSTSAGTVPIQRTRSTEASLATSSAASVTSSVGAAAVVGGTPLSTTRPSVVGGTPLSATRNPELIAEKSNGMSSGGKAGLAFGIILAFALAGGLLFFCWRRRKNQRNKDGAEKIIDEKHASANSFFGGTAAAFGAPAGNARESVQSEKSLRSTRTASTAPRLSLRPVTQFLPNIMDSRKSTGNALDVPAMSEKPRSAWERRAPGAEQDPFTDAAVLSEKQAQPESPPSNPFDEGDGVVAAGKMTASHSQQNSWEGSEPPTPKSTKFGTASAVAMTAGQATAAPRAANNVHRVQLDFKPSMEDELELRSGQLVRMLHEYDDGWVSSYPPSHLHKLLTRSIDALHSYGPFATGCLPTHLSIQAASQATSTRSTSAERSTWPPNGPATARHA